MDKGFSSVQNRAYMTGIMKRRSIIALCSGILEIIFVFFALLMGFNKEAAWGGSVFMSYMYFTMISNTIAALSVAFVIPFAVEGIRKKRFLLPRWISVFLFMSATSISIVMLIVVCFLSYTSPEEVFGNGGIYAHFFCPFLTLILFFQIEGGYLYSIRDRILACAPFSIYLILYYIMVDIIGTENGGWEDIYHIIGFVPTWAGFLIGVTLAYVMSCIISKLSNFLTKKRTEKMFWFWGNDVDPVEAVIEAYGLGTMAANNVDREIIEIPYDILDELAKRYGLERARLIKAFVKGLEAGTK